MHIDNDFNITDFLRSIGFEQTRDSDKRDNFKKLYFDPWLEKDSEIFVTLNYNGFNCYTTYSGHVMHVYTKDNNIYHGLWPHNFDFALSLFRHILPGKQEFEDIEKVKLY